MGAVMLRVVRVPSRLPSAFWVSVAMVAIVSSPLGGSGTIPDDAQRKGPGAAVTEAQRRGTPEAGLTAVGGRGPDKGVKEKGMVFEATEGTMRLATSGSLRQEAPATRIMAD